MDFRLSDEQQAVKDVVRDALARLAPAALGTALDHDRLWEVLSRDLGVTGIMVPARFGGAGMGFGELMPVVEELGAALAPGTFLGSAGLAASLLVDSGDEAAGAALLPGIASGDQVAAVHLGRSDEPALVARRQGESWLISGTTDLLSGGESATVLLAVADDQAGRGLYLVPLADGATVVAARSVFDPTSPAVSLLLDGITARRIDVQGEVADVVGRVAALAAVGVAAEQVGGAQRCLDSAVDYAKNRVQFGSPIGAFQAVKHACANVMIAVEAARVAVLHATWAADFDRPALTWSAHAAKSLASDAYVLAAATTVQVHGGIGFTWEHPAHLYLKRARATSVMHGSATYHRDALAGTACDDDIPAGR